MFNQLPRVLNYGNPIKRNHSLMRGLVGRYKVLPQKRGGSKLFDLAKSNHGTLTSGPLWCGSMGRRGGFGCISFDGTDDRVTCGAATLVTTTAALGCWYRRGASDAAGNQVLMSNGNDNYRLYVNFASQSFSMAGEYGTFPSLSFTVDISVGWHHLLCQATVAGNFELYLDGVQVAQSAKTKATTASSNFEIGRFTGSTLFTKGFIDDCIFWSRELSPSEVWGIYRATSSPYDPTLNYLDRPWLVKSGAAAGNRRRRVIIGSAA